MNIEIEVFEANDTWTLTNLLLGKKPISCKYVYKIKYKADSIIKRYKTRLVAKVGVQQIEGLAF